MDLKKGSYPSLKLIRSTQSELRQVMYVYTVPHLNIYTKRDAPKTINKSKWNSPGNEWDGEPISGCQESEIVAGEGDGCAIKWQREVLRCCNSTVSWLCWWLHRPAHNEMAKHCTYTHSTNVKFLVWILDSSYIRCIHWGKLCEGFRNFPVLFLQLPVSL